MLTFKERKFKKKDPKGHASVPFVQGVSKAVARIPSHLDVKVHMNLCTLRGAFSHVLKIELWIQTNQMSYTGLAAVTVIPAMSVRLEELSKLISLSIGRQLRRQIFPALHRWSMHGATTIILTGQTSAPLTLSLESSKAGQGSDPYMQAVRSTQQDKGCWSNIYKLPHNDLHPI